MRHGSSLSQSLDLDDDCLGVKVLVEDLFPETTRALFGSTNVSVLGGELALKEPCTVFRSKPGLLVERFNNKNEGALAHFHDHLLINDVQRRLVNQTHIQALLSASEHSIIRPVEHVSKGNDISCVSINDDLVLPRDELVVTAKELGLAVGFENEWKL